MPIVTRIIPQNMSVIVNRSISPLEHRALVTAFAAAKVAEVQSINRSVLGYETAYRAIVDGRLDGSAFNLKLDGGRAVYEFDLYGVVVKEIIEETLKALRAASPVDSGAYRDGHALYINGVKVDAVPETVKPTDHVMVSNAVPYARRIEIGKTKSGRAFVLQVPNRIYERVAKREIAQRFGNQAKILFQYVTLEGAPAVTGGLQARTPHYGTGRVGSRGGGRIKRRQSVGSQIEAPAIIIQPLAV